MLVAPPSAWVLPADLGARLDPLSAPIPAIARLRHAAVLATLLPAVDPAAGPRILLIERAAALRAHAGQLAFPGGKPEPDDRDLLETALREAEEEVSLGRGEVEVLGRLAPVPTPTGFLIIPFVARLHGLWQPTRIDRGEVAGILTPSLRDLCDPQIYQDQGSVDWEGQRYDLHQFAIHSTPLWGATARIVFDLLLRLGLDPRRGVRR